MSESKNIGQCRKQFEESYADNLNCAPRYAWITADALDRLAADVAAIRAKVDAISPEDVAHFVESEKAWVALVTEQRDAAIRERDAANQRRADTVRRLVQAQAEVAQLRDSRDVANRLFGAEQAKVERLRKELEQRQPAGNSPEIPDSSPAAPQPVGQGISPGLPETQPTGNAAPAAGWLTDRERRAVAYFAQVCRDDLVPDEWTDNAGVLLSILARAGSPPEQTAALWLTEEERQILANLLLYQWGNLGWPARVVPALNALLARAGSPPVVEVPAIDEWDAPARVEARAYRAALDKAGVKWKEVGRE